MTALILYYGTHKPSFPIFKTGNSSIVYSFFIVKDALPSELSIRMTILSIAFKARVYVFA